jgi:hypothetical protein
MKFLYIFDSQASQMKQEQKPKIIEILVALVETMGRLVSLEFLKHCTMSEVKILFYSIWNLAYEAKEHELYKECQLMLKSLYDTVKKFS